MTSRGIGNNAPQSRTRVALADLRAVLTARRSDMYPSSVSRPDACPVKRRVVNGDRFHGLWRDLWMAFGEKLRDLLISDGIACTFGEQLYVHLHSSFIDLLPLTECQTNNDCFFRHSEFFLSDVNKKMSCGLMFLYCFIFSKYIPLIRLTSETARLIFISVRYPPTRHPCKWTTLVVASKQTIIILTV